MKRLWTPKLESKVIQRAINLFFLLFLFFGSMIGGMVALFYQSQLDTVLADIKTQEMHAIELQKRLLSQGTNNVLSDLTFLTLENELGKYMETGDPKALEEAKKEYASFALSKKRYDQIRLLDEKGMEVVRVNYNDGKPIIVADAALQDKSNRYYFKETYRLSKGEAFISPLDLNVEHGSIEKPLNPVVRLGMPVFGKDGSKRGIVLVNYMAKALLASIRKAAETDYGTPMLLNMEGYWLLNENPEDEWGFMFDDRKNRTFARLYPDEWQEFNSSESGQISTKNGLFTFATIRPLSDFGPGIQSDVELRPGELQDYYWLIVYHIPQDVIGEYVSNLRGKLFLLGAGLFIVIAAAAWFLALAITRRKIYQSQLISMALYDSLTGLPNRKLFFDTLDQGLELAKRHDRQIGLLYIDLDGFKNVNDTLGHAAGDELLNLVAKQLRASTRKSDTVARLGGDEFAVILSEIDSFESAEMVGNKIIQALCAPIKLRQGPVSIGASIGVAVYPDTATEIEQLVKQADKAMYISKANGKNLCTPARVGGQS